MTPALAPTGSGSAFGFSFSAFIPSSCEVLVSIAECHRERASTSLGFGHLLVHCALHTARSNVCQHAFYLRFGRCRVDVVFAREECFDTLTRNIIRLAF